jgi:hypothetical protein
MDAECLEAAHVRRNKLTYLRRKRDAESTITSDLLHCRAYRVAVLRCACAA